MKKILMTLVISSAFGAMAHAQDWPQFLGPGRNSISEQKGILRSWPESGPEVLWTVNVGKGYGGPVVQDGKVYLLDRDDETGDILRCFELASGKELWNYSYEAKGTVMFPGSRSVPAIDGNYVYSCGHNGDLYCIDINTHKPVWNKNIWTDFGGGKLPIWAISQCPLIYGDLVVVVSQAPDAGVVAYKKLTGEIAWKTPNFLGNETYASPGIAKIDGKDHLTAVISSTNPFKNKDATPIKGKVVGLEPSSGEILWEYADWDCHISCSSPVDAGDNKILVTGGYERGATMFKVEKGPDGAYKTKELFTTLEFGDQTKPALLHNGLFYAIYRTNNKREGFVCMDMSGNVLWKTKRKPDFEKGSMILADGLIIATDGMKTLYLIEPDPQEFKPIAKADLLDDENAETSTQNWAPIALADGKLLIRNQSRMFCVKMTQ